MCFIVIIAQFYKYESILTVPDHFYISNQFILTYLYFRIFLYGHMHYDREIAKWNHCAAAALAGARHSCHNLNWKYFDWKYFVLK